MEQFGRYQLFKRVAVGGMAEIFLARSASLDGFPKDLVIKRIRPECKADERFFSLFIDEARISMSLSHQNIVQVFDFGQHDGAYYLAMEHVLGCDLEELGELPAVMGVGLDPALAFLIIREACRGLEYAHTRKSRRGESLSIIHRDISPQNIMVSMTGEVKITDFGIAKARGRLSQTEPGMVMGKLAYMSPEHATGMIVDHRADVFSCGVVLWELLVGQRVYSGEMGTDLFRRIRNAEVVPPSTKNKRIPKFVDQIVMRALAADPETRYASAREFGAELHRVLTHKYPDTSTYDLEAFVEHHRGDLEIVGFEDLEVEPEERPTVVITKAAQRTSSAADFDWTPELVESVEHFRRKPSLWHLLSMAAVCERNQQLGAVLAIYRVAAVKFAQQGLFAQCLLCCRRMLAHQSQQELMDEFSSWTELPGLDDVSVSDVMFRTDGPVEQLLKELLAQVHPTHGLVGQSTPLLSQLNGPAFAEFAAKVPLRKFPMDTAIVDQGQPGKTMFLIARGRVLVYATNANGERIYLSSLTAGDFFGENSFFTDAPRSATVVALYPVEAFEIDRGFYRRVMKNDPRAHVGLLRFYKERIVDTVLAKSRVFGLLPNDDRRALVDQFQLQVFSPGAQIIREGDLSDQIYLIKEGEAEVYTESSGERRILSVIGPGTLFGEVAALRGIARTASVCARTRLETMRLGGTDFKRIVDAKPEVREKVNKVVAERVRANLDKIVGGGPVA